MPAVQRKGDRNSGGGIITSGVNSVLVNGRPIAVRGLSVSPHPICGQSDSQDSGGGLHCKAKTQSNTTVFAGGRPVVVTGAVDTCRHSRVGGSNNVKVGR